MEPSKVMGYPQNHPKLFIINAKTNGLGYTITIYQETSKWMLGGLSVQGIQGSADFGPV